MAQPPLPMGVIVSLLPDGSLKVECPHCGAQETMLIADATAFAIDHASCGRRDDPAEERPA